MQPAAESAQGALAHADAYVCPACHRLLERRSASLACALCGLSFPVEDDIVDFAGGAYYDNFRPGQPLPPEHLAALEDEMIGTRVRIERFYAPRIDHRLRERTRNRALRVLDCGCGNGLAVDLLKTLGFEAWGVDLSALRKWQWRERGNRSRLAVADARRLPFPDEFFDAVISSGVIEHVGVRELRNPGYSVQPVEDQAQQRSRYLAELLRVARPEGIVWIDAPNGSFPIDFWHSGTMRGSPRFHSPAERFLPTMRELRDLLRGLGTKATIRSISPRHRFHFARLKRRWYGRAAAAAVRLFFRAIEVPPFRFLARSPLNPYLVVEIDKT